MAKPDKNLDQPAFTLAQLNQMILHLARPSINARLDADIVAMNERIALDPFKDLTRGEFAKLMQDKMNNDDTEKGTVLSTIGEWHGGWMEVVYHPQSLESNLRGRYKEKILEITVGEVGEYASKENIEYDIAWINSLGICATVFMDFQAEIRTFVETGLIAKLSTVMDDFIEEAHWFVRKEFGETLPDSKYLERTTKYLKQRGKLTGAIKPRGRQAGFVPSIDPTKLHNEMYKIFEDMKSTIRVIHDRRRGKHRGERISKKEVTARTNSIAYEREIKDVLKYFGISWETYIDPSWEGLVEKKTN